MELGCSKCSILDNNVLARKRKTIFNPVAVKLENRKH